MQALFVVQKFKDSTLIKKIDDAHYKKIKLKVMATLYRNPRLAMWQSLKI